jgi:hypothetical protein
MHSSTFLNIGSIWRTVVRFTPLPPYPRETASDTHCVGERMDLRAGMDVMEEGNTSFPSRKSKTVPSVGQPVASSLEESKINFLYA